MMLIMSIILNIESAFAILASGSNRRFSLYPVFPLTEAAFSKITCPELPFKNMASCQETIIYIIISSL